MLEPLPLRGASLGAPDGPDLPALSSSAEESIAAIGLEPGNPYSGRHFEPLQDLSRSRIDSPQIAFVTFPPVDCSHGFQWRIAFRCLARRALVHPLAMSLQ